MNEVLRRATPEDESILEAIERECFPHPHWTAAEFSKYETTVAEFEGRVVAFAVKQQVYEQTRNAPQDSEYEILNVAVSPAYRRLGVARRLLEAMMRGLGTYFLEVRESNAAAQALYASLGFEEVGRRPHYYQVPDETAIVMRVKRC